MKENKWHLPSKDILNAMYKNNIFVNGYYWSSTEDISTSFAWHQDIFTGKKDYCYKNSKLKVRAVRKLTEGHIEIRNIFRWNNKEYQAYHVNAPERMTWEEALKYCEGLNK